MLPIVIYTKRKIFWKYSGFSFFVFVWINKYVENKKRIIHHEKIHFWQQVELLFVLQWLLYVGFYCINRLKGMNHDDAYRNNPFEKEAFANDYNLNYLNTRRFLSWVRYV